MCRSVRACMRVVLYIVYILLINCAIMFVCNVRVSCTNQYCKVEGIAIQLTIDLASLFSNEK